MAARVTDCDDRFALPLEGNRPPGRHVLYQAAAADRGRGQDYLAIGLVVERAIARDDWKGKRAARFRDSVHRGDDLAHRLGSFRIAEIEIVGNRERMRADS